MGLLDDAIREHLDLKRRRGADPADVERAEQDALGPVRREAFEDEELVAGADLDHELEAEHDDHPAHDEGHPAHAENGDSGDVLDQDEAYTAPEPVAAEPPATVAEPAAPAPEPPGPAPTELDESAHHAPEPPAQHAPEPAPGEATVEYDVEQELASEGRSTPHDPEPDDEDVLEETPEFLQDTPDHDRLWFEQRPPRDFDFDG